MTEPHDDDELTIKEAALLVRRSVARIHAAIQRGQLTIARKVPHPGPGGFAYLVRRADVLALWNPDDAPYGHLRQRVAALEQQTADLAQEVNDLRALVVRLAARGDL